jgi:hypothetical protein
VEESRRRRKDCDSNNEGLRMPILNGRTWRVPYEECDDFVAAREKITRGFRNLRTKNKKKATSRQQHYYYYEPAEQDTSEEAGLARNVVAYW